MLIGALWAHYAFNRLWQGSLATDAAAGLAAADARGLKLKPAGLRARLVAAGDIGGCDVRVEWRGGVRGAHSVVMVADTLQTMPLLADAESLDTALNGALALVQSRG